MGKAGTQLLRHCVRLLVLVSTDLLAVRLSGIVSLFVDLYLVYFPVRSMFMCKVYGMYVYRHVGIENNNKNNFLLLYAYEQYICRLFQLIFFFLIVCTSLSNWGMLN